MLGSTSASKSITSKVPLLLLAPPAGAETKGSEAEAGLLMDLIGGTAS
jgi:hypothetical protein